MRTRLLLPALLATAGLFGGSAAMAATATTVPAKTAAVTATATKAPTAVKSTAAKSSAAKSTSAKSTSAMAKIDVNKASSTTLRKLPGVGPKLAQEIISGRPYKDASMLQKRLDKYLSTTAAAKLETHFSY